MPSPDKNKGQSLIEMVIAVGLFVTIVSFVVGLVLNALVAGRYGQESDQAAALAQEGIEAAKAIRDRTWLNLTNGDHGLTRAGGFWEFSGTSDTIGKFTRKVNIASVNRDSGGNIVTSGGTLDARTKLATSTVTWEFELNRTRDVSTSAYLTDWNVFDWLETTDAHFCKGTVSNVKVRDTGSPSRLELKITGGESFVPANGKTFTDTTNTDFNSGTYSSTEVNGTGTAASVQLATVADSWANQTSPTSNQFNGVSMVTGCDGQAVATGGVIARWDGTSWASVTSPTTVDLHAIHMRTASDGWAVGPTSGLLGIVNAVIIRWNGTLWTPVSSPSNRTLNSVHMVSASDGWAVGNTALLSTGVIIRWNGTSWNTVSSPTSNSLRDVFMVSASDGWAVGDSGTIIRWNGSSWSTVSSPTGQDLFSVHMVSASDGWAVGASGTIVRWNGTSWSTATSPTTQALRGVYLSDTSNGWAVGATGTIIRWNGTSWATQTSPTTNNLFSISGISSKRAWTVGASGRISRFVSGYAASATFASRIFDSNAGTTNWHALHWSEAVPANTEVTMATRTGNTATPDGTWSAFSAESTSPGSTISSPDNTRYIQYRATLSSCDGVATSKVHDATIVYDPPTTNNLNSVDTASSSFAFSVGDLGTIVKWDGALWASVTSPTAQNLNEVSIVSTTDAWAVGALGTIIRWNGSTWSTVTSPTTNALNSIDMVSAIDGWGVGALGTIIRWNGSTWSAVTSPTPNGLNSVYMVSATDGWAVGDLGTIIRWNGSAWSTVTSPTTNNLNGIALANASDGWAAGILGTIIRWNGSAWSSFTSPVTVTLTSVSMFGCGDGTIVGALGNILRWDGAAWNSLGTSTINQLNSVKQIAEDDGWTVGALGVILRLRINDPVYAASGTFISQALDSNAASDWETLYWTENLPAATDVTVATRTGNVAVPDGTWSAFSAEQTNPNGQAIPSPDATRYIQYRVTLTTGNTAVTSRLDDALLTYKQ